MTMSPCSAPCTALHCTLASTAPALHACLQVDGVPLSEFMAHVGCTHQEARQIMRQACKQPPRMIDLYDTAELLHRSPTGTELVVGIHKLTGEAVVI